MGLQRICICFYRMETHLSAPPSSLPALPKIFGKSSRAITHFIDLFVMRMWKLATLGPLQPGRLGIYLTNPRSSRPISHNIETTCLWGFFPLVLLKQNPTKQHRQWISCLLTWRVCGLVVFLVLSHKAGGLVKCLVGSCHENMTWNCRCYGWTVFPTMWNSNV